MSRIRSQSIHTIHQSMSILYEIFPSSAVMINRYVSEHMAYHLYHTKDIALFQQIIDDEELTSYQEEIICWNSIISMEFVRLQG